MALRHHPRTALLRHTQAYGDVYFSPELPLLRGYVVHSEAMRQAVVDRLAWLDGLNCGALAAVLLLGWVANQFAPSLGIWMLACELTYRFGMRPLTQQMTPLPLRASLRCWAADAGCDLLLAGIVLAATFAALAMIWGLLREDFGSLALGVALAIWMARLTMLLFGRLI